MRTLIQADYVVGLQDGAHRLLSPGCVVIENEAITHVGPTWNRPADQRIHLPGRLILPGLIDLHLHAGVLAFGRLYADQGRPELFGAGYLEYGAPAENAPAFGPEPAEAGALALAEALLSGSTTVVEFGGETGIAPRNLVAAAGLLGLRLYTAPGFRSARYRTTQDGRLAYEWDRRAGEAGLDEAVSFIEQHDLSAGGRIRGMLFPLQADTCDADLLRRVMDAADRLRVPVHLHAAQGVVEVHEMLRRTGLTPLRWLDELGILRPNTIVAHAIFHDAHPLVAVGSEDLGRLARSRATVAHCAVAMARRGIALRSFASYRRRGIRVALGTDTFPHDMLQEMRIAAYLGRVVDGSVNVAGPWEALTAATIDAADALGRPDLGRLAPGAKGDLVAIDLRSVHFGAVYDPVASLIACGTARDVEHVWVDGRMVVRDRRLLTIDPGPWREAAQTTAEAAWRDATRRDAAERGAEQISGLAPRRWQDSEEHLE
ncbi:MAG: amidohydrolase family protein [Armatimonadetes bacterium]|nr:amidohydrolase family protein [Armatimonadota bacterium]